MEIGISHQYSPSFSSTLLDSIYRSIDLAAAGDDDMAIYTTESTRTTTTKQSKTDEEMANFRRACMIEKWMEKKAFEKSVARRNSDQFPRKSENSSWSSSDSSAAAGGGGSSFFSPSSEAESLPLPRPRPVRTGGASDAKLVHNRRGGESDPKPKDESGGFLRTKSRALKIYGDLKKVKQPISPGGKLAGFLNSLFPGAAKSTKADYSTNASSTCSSASSFSRSCLSKTPSSRGKASSSSNSVKRSVRFSPVSVIVGGGDEEDSRSHTRNKIHPPSKPGATTKSSIRSVINEELMLVDKNRRGGGGGRVVVEEVISRDYLLRNYHHMSKSHVQNRSFDDDYEEEEEDDDDAASYASSDLFELDNLSAIGMDHQRYREELPVYETTRLDRTNRHVVNGGMVF